MGAGSMMGQTDMGTMTWQLTQNGSTVTGAMPGNDVRRRHDVHDGHADKQHDVL